VACRQGLVYQLATGSSRAGISLRAAAIGIMMAGQCGPPQSNPKKDCVTALSRVSRASAQGFDGLLDLTSCGSDSIGDLSRQVHMPVVVGVARVREAVQLVAKIKLVEGRL